MRLPMLMSAAGYSGSPGRYGPSVFINDERFFSVADDPRLTAGIRTTGVISDYASRPDFQEFMVDRRLSRGKVVNRMLHVRRDTTDPLQQFESLRLICPESRCAPRYPSHDAPNAISATAGHSQRGLRERNP